MNKLNEKIKNFDSNLDPSLGNKLRFIFKTITLVLIIIILPIITVVVGSIALNAETFEVLNTKAIMLSGFIPWFILVIVSGSLWYYFSKWIPS